MPNVDILQQAFVGGEIAPEMRGRVDDVGYKNGLAVCRNFTIRPQGTADNRAGFRFVREVKDSSRKTRLIPFTFSGEQTMVIEFGHQYCRFHTEGATVLDGANPYEIVTPYDEAHLFDIHHVQSADILTLVHPDYPPKELRRYGATDWRLVDIAFMPKVAAPDNVKAQVTRVSSPLNINIDYRYVVTSVQDAVESQGGAEIKATGDLYQNGNKITLSWDKKDGATEYRVYRYQAGGFGYIGTVAQSDAPSFEDTGANPDLSKTPPQFKEIFAGAGNYPAAVSYFQQRRIFAGTKNEPQKIWMTRSGTESDMSYSIPSRDDDRIEIRVAAREANRIRHIVPMTNLLVMTNAAEWHVGTQNSDILTSSTISVDPQSYNGASNVQPVIVNASLIYCAARGGHVRELAYARDAGGFVSGDLSMRAPHLFDRREIVDMAYGKAPYPLLWFVSDDGRLLGNTYVPEQEIGAWHRHDTDGRFESCAVVAEGHEDVLYVIVRREVNGQAKRYVERLESRAFDKAEDAFFVDSGLTYRGAPAGTITGLEHLEGKTVSILADGAVMPAQTVRGGQIRLVHPASVVQVGLPIIADMETLPFAAQLDNAYARGRRKNVNEVWLDVLGSSGIWAGADADNIVEAKQRTTEPPGTPPRLKSAQVHIVVRPQWNDYGQVFVRQQDPLPLSIVSLTMGVAVA